MMLIPSRVGGRMVRKPRAEALSPLEPEGALRISVGKANSFLFRKRK
jgi:hypothetical protein